MHRIYLIFLAAVLNLGAAPVKARPDVVTQAKLWMALLGIVLLGLLMVMLTMLASAHVRRVLRRSRKPRHPTGGEDWYKKPLAADADGPSNDAE